MRDYGVVCIQRKEDGQDVVSGDSIVEASQVLARHKEHILVVEDSVQYNVSSSLLRQRLRDRLSIRYLTPDPVIQYIETKGHDLFEGCI